MAVSWAAPPSCTISGQVFQPDLQPFANGSVLFSSNTTQVVGGFTIDPISVVAQTDANGNLSPSPSLPQGLVVSVALCKNGSCGASVPAVIPLNPTANFGDILAGMSLSPTNANMAGARITNVGCPTTANDALAEGCAIGAASPSTGTFTDLTAGPGLLSFLADLNMNSHKVTNLAPASESGDAIVQGQAGARLQDLTSDLNGVVNIMSPQYGALCNGGDDSAAISAAATAAAGSILFIPYTATGCGLGSYVTLPSNIRITGPGKLVYTSSSANFPMLYARNASNITLDHVHLIGPQPSGGVSGTGTSVPRTNDTSSINGQEGLLCINCSNVTIDHVTASNFGYQGFTFVGGSHFKVTNNYLENNVAGGGQAQSYVGFPVSDVVFSGNTASNNGSAAVQGDGFALEVMQNPTASSGTGTISSSGTAVTGSGTRFTTELAVGDLLIGSDGQGRLVVAIASDTALSVYPKFSPDQSGAAFTYLHNAVSNNGIQSAQVVGNVFENNSLAGFESHGINTCTSFPYSIRDVKFVGNTVKTNGWWGVNIQDTMGASVNSNVVSGNGVLPAATVTYGILMLADLGSTVTANSVTDNNPNNLANSYGIALLTSSSTKCAVASVVVGLNVLRNNGTGTNDADLKLDSSAGTATNSQFAFNDMTSSTTTSPTSIGSNGLDVCNVTTSNPVSACQFSGTPLFPGTVNFTGNLNIGSATAPNLVLLGSGNAGGVEGKAVGSLSGLAGYGRLWFDNGPNRWMINNNNTGKVEVARYGGTDALANLTPCTASFEGVTATATNCNAACSSGGTCTAGGSTHCEVRCNGSNYIETGL
jgi:hypothetical protein